jgi:Winged helix DNA-binding domain
MTNTIMAHQRLSNQHISAVPFELPAEVVYWLAAVQAQDFAGAKWALGLRMRAATDASVEQAFTEGAILRTHVLRPTWHFVTPADIHWLLALTAPRVHALNAPYYRKLELDQDLHQRITRALERALAGGKQLTRDEVRDVLAQAGIATAGELRMSYMLMRAELDGVICSGARRGKQFTYALLHDRAPHARHLERDHAVAELAGRFFLSRGPATVHDFARWSGLTVTDAKAGLEAIKSQLQHELVDRQTYWRSPATPALPDRPPAALLMSIYDEYISGYKDRSAMVAPSYGEKLQALGNALTAIIVVDGMVVGTWKRVLKKEGVLVTTDIFRALTDAESQAVEKAVEQYAAFLQLPALPPDASTSQATFE